MKTMTSEQLQAAIDTMRAAIPDIHVTAAWHSADGTITHARITTRDHLATTFLQAEDAHDPERLAWLIDSVREELDYWERLDLDLAVARIGE